MRTIITLSAIVAAALLAGCSGNSVEQPQTTTLTGRPVSVSEAYGHSCGAVATVIRTDSSDVLAHVSGYIGKVNSADAQALISAEIAKGDSGSVTLTGKYQGNEFIIQSVDAHGYNVEF
ncbi:MAG: hypothetical protein V1725_06795 [archaeon]